MGMIEKASRPQKNQPRMGWAPMPKWPFYASHGLLALVAVLCLAFQQPLDAVTVAVCVLTVVAGTGLTLLPHWVELRELRRRPAMDTELPKQVRALAERVSGVSRDLAEAKELSAQIAEMGNKELRDLRVLLDGIGKTAATLQGNANRVESRLVALEAAQEAAEVTGMLQKQPDEKPAAQPESQPQDKPAATAGTEPPKGTMLAKAFSVAQNSGQTQAVNRIIQTGFGGGGSAAL